MAAPLSGGAFQRRVRLFFARVPTLGGLGWDGARAGIVTELSAKLTKIEVKKVIWQRGLLNKVAFFWYLINI
jgi:hypothetical protein